MLNACYRAASKRIVLMGDGEDVTPDFHETYASVIEPCLDKRDAGFAMWPNVTTGQSGNTVNRSDVIRRSLGDSGSVTGILSNGVLNRTVTIRALKEAQDCLITNPSLELPGRRIGTDLLISLRHCDVFKRWLYVDKVLTQGRNTPYLARDALAAGYDVAREQAACRPPEPSPRIILSYSDYKPQNEAAKERQKMAQASWAVQISSGEIIGCPYTSKDLPKIRELLYNAAIIALPEDVLVYANSDAGLTTQAAQKLITGVSRGFGVTCCAKREVEKGGVYASVKGNKMPGGIELIAMTPAWWARHRELMPDMYIGREAWDAVFMHLAEEWADGRTLDGICRSELYRTSKAHTDDVCWHVEHESFWAENRMDPLNVHNRKCAKDFFAARNTKTIWENE